MWHTHTHWNKDSRHTKTDKHTRRQRMWHTGSIFSNITTRGMQGMTSTHHGHTYRENINTEAMILNRGSEARYLFTNLLWKYIVGIVCKVCQVFARAINIYLRPRVLFIFDLTAYTEVRVPSLCVIVCGCFGIFEWNFECNFSWIMKMEESPLEVLSRAVSIVQKAQKRHSGGCIFTSLYSVRLQTGYIHSWFFLNWVFFHIKFCIFSFSFLFAFLMLDHYHDVRSFTISFTRNF